MKRTFYKIAGKLVYGLIPAVLLFTLSCDDDESNVKAVKIDFTSTSLTVSENAPEELVILSLAGPAQADATIEVTIATTDATYGESFITLPDGSSGKLELSIAKGQTAAQFRMIPLDNELMNSPAVVVLGLSNPSDALTVGEGNQFTITMTDDEGPTQINFVTDQSSTSESGNPVVVDLALTSSAPGAGTTVVDVTSNGVYGTDYTTTPAAVDGHITLETAVGDIAESITVTPLNDADVNATVTVTLTVASAEGGVETGVNQVHTVSITDDETPSTATFGSNTALGLESASTGVEMTINFAPATNAAGTLELTLNSAATYGTHYTTDPAAVNNKISLNIANGTSASTIKVIPVNNNDENANFTVAMEMTASTGVVVIGSEKTTTFTIADDDQVTSIANIRAMHTGAGDVTLAAGTNIRGVVVSTNGNLTPRNAYIQDGTGAILIRFVANNSFAMGDDVKVNLSGAVMTSFNGNLQLAVANANAEKKGTASLPAYQVVTLAELTGNFNNYEGELVQVEGVGFPDADGSANMSGTKNISDGTTTIGVRSESYANWSATVIPYGLGVVRGVAAEFNGAVQITPMDFTTDVTLTTGNRSINLTQALAAFGSVANGAQSTSQQFTFSGANLTQDVVVSVSSNYKVSKNNTDFASSVTFTAAESGSTQTVYVKFTPASGTDGAIEGTVKLRSLGAEAKSFTVSGSESGNTAGATRVMNELFEFGAGAALTANGWTQSGATATNPVSVSATALAFTGYPAVGGNSIEVKNTGQDIYKAFTTQTSGEVYLAFVANVSAVGTGDYFLGLSPSTLQTNYYARLHLKASGAGYNVGVKKNNETNAVYGTSVLNLNTAYLFIVKYKFNSGSTTDDAISVYVFDAATLPGSEPGSGEVNALVEATRTDPADLGFVTIRQGGGAAVAPTMIMDGIRVAGSWMDLFN